MIKTTTDFVTTFVLGFKRNGQWLRKTQLSKGPFIYILRKHSRVRNAKFGLPLVVKRCLNRGEGVQKSQKCDNVLYKWSLIGAVHRPIWQNVYFWNVLS